MRKWGLHVNAGDRGRLCLSLLLFVFVYYLEDAKEGGIKKKPAGRPTLLGGKEAGKERDMPKDIVSIPGERRQHDTKAQ